MKNIPKISWTWNEGRYWDLWMTVHILSGVMLALMFEYMGIGLIAGLVMAFILMTIWEIVEVFFNVQESYDNRVLDVVYGVIAYALTHAISISLHPRVTLSLLIISAVISAFLSYRGWEAYRKRISKSK